MGIFAIYTRASIEGPNGQLSSNPEEQEASALAWAAVAGVEVEPERTEEVASGGLGADDRKLGLLIDRIERGELGGIVVSREDRFARDVIAGATALRRI